MIILMKVFTREEIAAQKSACAPKRKGGSVDEGRCLRRRSRLTDEQGDEGAEMVDAPVLG